MGGVFGAPGCDSEYTAWGFGDSPAMATELGLLVRDGPKRATAGLRVGVRRWRADAGCR